MKVYCVKFYDEGNGKLEMCYPAIDASSAIALCEKDFPNATYYVAEEVM